MQKQTLGAWQSDDECETELASGAATANARTLEDAIRQGLWGCAESIGRKGTESGVELRSVVDMESRVISKKLATLKDAIESSLPVQVILPAYQWAQSPSEIYLNVKFSHKLDAPATLNVEANTVNVTSTSVVLEASNGRKSFQLNLSLYGEVQGGDAAVWSMASVGRMTFTLKKKEGERSKWPRLLADAGKKPGNQHFWYSQAEQFSDELEELEEEEMKRRKQKREEKEQEEKQEKESEGSSTKEADNKSDDGGADAPIPVEETAEEKEFKAEKAKVTAETKAQVDTASQKLRKAKRSIDEDAKRKKAEENAVFSAEKKKLEADRDSRIKELAAKYGMKDDEL